MYGGKVLLLAAVLPLLSGCPWNTVVREPVEVVHTVYVPIPKSLTRHCPIDKGRNASGKELLRVARSRRASLEGCNGQLDAIDRIQGTEVPKP